MTFLTFTIMSYVLLGLTAPLFTQFDMTFLAPEIAVGILMGCSTYLPRIKFILFALVLGALLDGFYPLAPLGLHMERLVLLAYATRGLLGIIPARTIPTRIMVGMLLSCISDFILFLLLAIFDHSFSAYSVIFKRIIPHALITGITVPVLDFMFNFAGQRLTLKKDRIFFS